MSAHQVTVAVVSWNTRTLLGRCLDSLRPEVEAGRAAVRVVDNGSSDGSAELVAEAYPWAGLVKASWNLGFGGAVNEASRGTATPWIAPANADIELTAGALEALLRIGDAHPEAGVIAPRLVLPDGSVQRSVFGFPSFRATVLANAGVHLLRDSWATRLHFEAGWDPMVEQVVDYAMGAFLLVRRAAFDTVGGFDPDQWMFAEDMDLSWRLRNAGWSTLFTPAATVRHAGGAATDVAFEASATTSLKLGALYAWLARRRGTPTMVAFAGVNLIGALARYVAATVLRPVPGRPKERASAARTWLRVTWNALSDRRAARTETGVR